MAAAAWSFTASLFIATVPPNAMGHLDQPRQFLFGPLRSQSVTCPSAQRPERKVTQPTLIIAGDPKTRLEIGPEESAHSAISDKDKPAGLLQTAAAVSTVQTTNHIGRRENKSL
jgi:hypothetical protein